MIRDLPLAVGDSNKSLCRFKTWYTAWEISIPSSWNAVSEEMLDPSGKAGLWASAVLRV